MTFIRLHIVFSQLLLPVLFLSLDFTSYLVFIWFLGLFPTYWLKIDMVQPLFRLVTFFLNSQTNFSSLPEFHFASQPNQPLIYRPTATPTSKAGIMGMPSKYFYPLLATSLLLLILACVVISTVMYRCVLHNRDYSLIKKVPSSLSNIYLDVDEVLPLPKKVEVCFLRLRIFPRKLRFVFSGFVYRCPFPRKLRFVFSGFVSPAPSQES